MGLLKPAQVDRFTDYRYYALEQLPRLNRILALKDLGLSLDQIKQLVDQNVPAEELRRMLATKHGEIEQQLQTEQSRLNRVEARLHQIEQENGPQPAFDVVLKSTPAQTVIRYGFQVPHISEIPEHRHQALEQIYAWLNEHKITAYGDEIFQYFNEGWTEENIAAAAGVILDAKLARAMSPLVADPLVLVDMPAALTVAGITYQGTVWDIPVMISNLYTWLAKNDYTSAGPICEVHLAWSECDIDEQTPVIFEIRVPVTQGVA